MNTYHFFMKTCYKKAVLGVLILLSQRGNFRQLKYWKKSKEKFRKYFGIWTKGIKELDLGEKFKNFSCVCTFKYLISEICIMEPSSQIKIAWKLDDT
jgi:hypothetical protein